MKDKVKQLAEEAGFVFWGDEDWKPEGQVIDWSSVYDKELEKFAELIVRECSKVITHGGYWSGGIVGERRQCTPPEIAKMIREHFGVE